MSGGGVAGQIGNWAGGAATVTLGAAQALYGYQQQKKNKRPTYEIPPEIAQNLSQGEQDAAQGIPEEQKDQYLSNLQRSSSYRLSQLGNRKAGLAGVAAVGQDELQGYGNMLAQDSAMRMQNKQKLYGLRSDMAQYKDQAFQINKSNPYYENRAQNNALIGAGMQNVSQGFQAGNTSGGNFGGQPQQIQQQQMYFTPSNANSQTGMYNYNPQSIENNPNNGSYGYQGQQYDPGMS